MPLFSRSRKSSSAFAAPPMSASKEKNGVWWRSGGSTSSNGRGRGRAASGIKGGTSRTEVALPLPFSIPTEVLWTIRQWDWATTVGCSLSMWEGFLSLPRETQSLVSWAFLLFTIVFISGLWTLKLGLLVFLMLFKPFEDPKRKKERLAAASARKTKLPKGGSRGKMARSGDGFSADPLISALQRIPETFTLGNVPSVSSSSIPSIAATPNRIVSSPPPFEGRLPSGSHPLPLQPPQQHYHPSLQLLRDEEPPAYDTSSSTDSRGTPVFAEGSNSRGMVQRDYNSGRRPRGDLGIGLGPAPFRTNGPVVAATSYAGAQTNRAVTAPLHAPAHMKMTPAMGDGRSFAATIPAPHSDQPVPHHWQSRTTTGDRRIASSNQVCSPPSTANDDPAIVEPSLTVWEQQQRQVLLRSGGVRHKSASFHRLEQAQKFWNRKFSSGTTDGENGVVE